MPPDLLAWSVYLQHAVTSVLHAQGFIDLKFKILGAKSLILIRNSVFQHYFHYLYERKNL